MTKTVTTFCSICERSCGMQVRVENNRATKVSGYKEHVRSKGDLCVKGHASLDILYAPDRLQHPMKKTGGQWHQIGWDEAFDAIADRLLRIKDAHGPESLAVYHGQTYLKNNLAMSLMKRLLRIYGSPNLCSAASECFIPQLLAGITTFGGLPMADVENSRCVIIWGANPFASGSLAGCSMPRTIRIFKELKQKGVQFIVIDPRTAAVAQIADLHLQVRPGADGALALGMMRAMLDENLLDRQYIERHTSGFDKLVELIKSVDLNRTADITRVARKDIIRAARLFGTVKPASIITGVGVEHHTNTVQTIRAIMTLLALTGNIDITGGNTFFAPVMFSPVDQADLPSPAGSPVGMDEHPLFSSMINQAHALVLIEKILAADESPVKALLVAGGAPIPELANTGRVKAALNKIEFKAVIDLFMTPTAREADLVLPAACFLERDEIGTMPVNRQRRAVAPEGQLPDWEIWLRLARHMGYGQYFPWRDFEAAADFLLQSAGLSCAALEQHPGGISNDLPPGTFLHNGFYTYSGKIELYSNSLASAGYDPVPAYIEPLESPVSAPDVAREYPLVLITGARQPMFLHSQHRTIESLRKLHPEPYLEIHPETARQYGLGNGDQARIFSPRGWVRLKVTITDGILPGVVHMPHGWADADCNLLTDHAKRDPISGFPGLRSCLCSISRA